MKSVHFTLTDFHENLKISRSSFAVVVATFAEMVFKTYKVANYIFVST